MYKVRKYIIFMNSSMSTKGEFHVLMMMTLALDFKARAHKSFQIVMGGIQKTHLDLSPKTVTQHSKKSISIINLSAN